MSIGLDPDQAQCSVQPDLGPNCLQRLSTDYSRQLIKRQQASAQLSIEFIMLINVKIPTIMAF